MTDARILSKRLARKSSRVDKIVSRGDPTLWRAWAVISENLFVVQRVARISCIPSAVYNGMRSSESPGYPITIPRKRSGLRLGSHAAENVFTSIRGTSRFTYASHFASNCIHHTPSIPVEWWILCQINPLASVVVLSSCFNMTKTKTRQNNLCSAVNDDWRVTDIFLFFLIFLIELITKRLIYLHFEKLNLQIFFFSFWQPLLKQIHYHWKFRVCVSFK